MNGDFITRRGILFGAAATLAACSQERLPGNRPALFTNEGGNKALWTQIHGGAGLIAAKSFQFQGAAHPANFVEYTLPPGASEGVHVHKAGTKGAFDEFYYIVSGTGCMQIGGEVVPVKPGDHIFTPLGVPHGIENTSRTDLKVLLTFVRRTL